MKRGRIFIISAPSGTGKSTVVAALRREKPELKFSISCTTRQKRGSEVDGRDYHFIDGKTFQKMVSKNEFAEWANVHGEMYGTPRAALMDPIARGEDIILDIDVQGGMAIKKAFPDAISIFLMPPSLEVLKERLVGRGTDSPAKIALRLKNARTELTFKDRYDHVVTNGDLEQAVSELLSIFARVSGLESRG